ncbi:MAG: helix-turn-helix transcriptional regulator [Gammaproteobacteria bacterium]|nr:helix-turn-helix transcriptional regulator [Gammaproteobacteria bacterium]
MPSPFTQNTALVPVRDALFRALDEGRQPVLPGAIGLFHCRRDQQLHGIPLHFPTLVAVLAGTKEISCDGQFMCAGAGELVLLPPGIVQLANRPDAAGRYLALAMGFPPPVDYARTASTPQQDTWVLPAPGAWGLLLSQWIELHQRHPMPADWHLGRQRELLTCLADTGMAGHLLKSRPRVRDLLLERFYGDLRHDWQLSEVATSLHRSASTLQRQLQREQCSFRELLEEARMVTALGLLQGTLLPIGQVAEQVGYQSASRFAERFRARFGLLPSALRQTQRDGDERKDAEETGAETIATTDCVFQATS